MNPTWCGAVWVELGPTSDLDRLQQCDRTDCYEHTRQLNWVRDADHLLAYTEQVRRFQQQRQPQVDQGALL